MPEQRPRGLLSADALSPPKALEDRCVPATLLVNSLLDNVTAGDGLVTLREAITAANNDAGTDLGQTGSGPIRSRSIRACSAAGRRR